MLACTLVLTSSYQTSAANADTKAAALKLLGLFKGVSETEERFDLDRAPTRIEALVMLLRVMGKESEVLAKGGTHPFTDVPLWADKYVGYAYENGLTNGISANTFGNGTANANMYLTFMLRALGYSDAKGDFVWEAPSRLAKAVGLLSVETNTDDFLRADVAIVSWAALETDYKGEDLRLAKRLMADGVFSSDDYGKAIDLVGEPKPESLSVSTYGTLKTALADAGKKRIVIDATMTIDNDLVIPEGITLIVNRGNDLNIEATLTNNGTLIVEGANEIMNKDFINYAVTNIRNGGKIINNGSIRLSRAFLDDTKDHGPIGGQLRLFDGSLINHGSVFLKAAPTNTHGGMLAVVDGIFSNNGIVIVDGFQIVVAGTFENNEDGVIINNTYIATRDKGVFKGNGKLSGNAVVKESF